MSALILGDRDISTSVKQDNQAVANNLISFFVIPFNFLHFLLCSPFRLKIDKENLIVIRLTPQIILCAVVTITDILFMIKTVQISFVFSPKNAKNPSFYLSIIGLTLSNLNKCLMIKTFWQNQKEIVELANFVRNQGKLKSYFTSLKRGTLKRWILSVTMLYTVVGFLSWIEDKTPVQQNQTGIHFWWNTMVQHAHGLFFLGNRPFHGLEVTLGIITATGILQR